MNKQFTRMVTILSLVALFAAACLTESCARKRSCKGVVTVLNANGEPIAGMLVHLEAGDIDDLESTTDVSGKAIFETELPKLMYIWLDAPPLTNTQKVVRFEEGKSNEVTVYH